MQPVATKIQRMPFVSATSHRLPATSYAYAIVLAMKDFWKKLPKPFFALAPLEDVTDAAFRRLIARYGKPDVMFTEFTSADGLFFADERGQEKLRAKLIFSDSERPIVAQLFTASPERMKKAAQIFNARLQIKKIR